MGLAVTWLAAAAGVMSNDNSSKAPTNCTLTATTRLSANINSKDKNVKFKCCAWATCGSTAANNMRWPNMAMIDSTITATTNIDCNSAGVIATICPVNKPNLLEERPWYKDKNNTPSPSPNGNKIPTTELRFLPSIPMTPSTMPAVTAPMTAPRVTEDPNHKAHAAPANDSSAVPCTANAMSRACTIGPMNPAITPNNTAATMDVDTKGNSSAKLSKLMMVCSQVVSSMWIPKVKKPSNVMACFWLKQIN